MQTHDLLTSYSYVSPDHRVGGPLSLEHVLIWTGLGSHISGLAS